MKRQNFSEHHAWFLKANCDSFVMSVLNFYWHNYPPLNVYPQVHSKINDSKISYIAVKFSPPNIIAIYDYQITT